MLYPIDEFAKIFYTTNEFTLHQERILVFRYIVKIYILNDV
jgi:hypothetical protein